MFDLENNFICATREYNTPEKGVCAPLFRREFDTKNEDIKSAEIYIAARGYYELHINGKDITKGITAPYRSNPLHYVYYDRYNVTELINGGKNVIGVILGNGFQNSAVKVWDFDKLPWRSAPSVSFTLKIEYANGEKLSIKSDENTKTANSAITFNDFHLGEHYNAELEIENWDKSEFDASDWSDILKAEPLVGELRECKVEPIIVTGELKPVSITECDGGYIYDFGENNSGLYRLKINGKSGQELSIKCFEIVTDCKPDTRCLDFDGQIKTDSQHNKYICREGLQTHIPRFTYFGYQYIYVKGITSEQATEELFTFLTASSDIKQIGSFECSDEMINKIQKATEKSDISNFYYFPTDCPHREKQGWTADAALSAEQMLYNLTPEKSWREWLLNIYKEMQPDGRIPGIVPTGGWGYAWGNGPAWDCVIAHLPYYSYIYRGDIRVLEDSAEPLERYLKYLNTRIDEKGLIAIGLGDWCQPQKVGGGYDTPLCVTDTLVSADIADKAAFIYDVLNMPERKSLAEDLSARLKKAFSENLIKGGLVEGSTQTGQAMALYYGAVPEKDKAAAFDYLLKFIDEKGGHIGTGVLGGRVIFRLLTDNGYGDLALNMITRTDGPSYGNWIKRGATTLWESFWREDQEPSSKNHHFWGDVSAWFYSRLAGIRINSTGKDINNIDIKPTFLSKLDFVKAETVCAGGKVYVEWHRSESEVKLSVKVPENIHGKVILPSGEQLLLESKTYYIDC